MGCGRRAEAQDRMPVEIRDLAYFGRPARLGDRSATRDEVVAARKVLRQLARRYDLTELLLSA